MRFHKILSSLLFVCLLAQLFLHPGGAAAAPPRQIASAEATVLPADSFRTGRRASLADAQAYRYMEGHGYTYEQEMAVTTTSFTQDAAGVTPVADRFETTSTVRLVPVRQLASGAHLLQVTISDPHMWTVEAGQRVDGMTRELAAELAKPFYAVQNATGRIETVFVATDELTGSANLKRGIFSGFQVEVDDAPAGAAVEADPNGDVTSSYARVAVDDQVVITRERDEADYIRLVDPAIPMDAVDIAETQTAIFNPGLGALSVISSTEHFATADPARFPYAGKGVGTWTTIDGQSLLRLSTVSSAPVSEPLPSVARDATPAAMLAAINRATGRPYQASTLRAPYEAPVENIDPTVDLRTALAELAADQTGSFGFIHQLGQALKSSPARLDELVSLLRAGAVDRALYPQLAVALAAVGTPQAQAIMIGQLLQDPAAPEATRNAVLMTLPDLKTPDAATMRAVQDLSESRDPLAEQARLVLGGLLEVQAASDPAAAAAGVARLEATVQQTTEVSKLATLYVALGNAAAPSSLPVFEAGLAHSDPRVRFEALVGLRDLPADQTIKLIDSALSDPDPAVAETAGEMLKTLTGTTPQPSANTNEGPGPAWNWNDNFGGGNIYANIHVNLSATKPYGHLKLNGQADIDVHLLNKVHKNDVVKVQATTYVIASNTRRFGFYLFVMGDKFKYYEKDVKCADTPLSGTVWKGSRALFTYDWGWKIKGIGFGLTLSFGASMEIKYALSYQACDTNATIAATLNPGIWIWTKGDAGLNIGLFKAGVVAEVEFLRTWLPVTLSAKAGASGLKIGYNVSLQFKPIAVYISAYWAWLKCVNFWKWQWEWQYQNKGLWSWEHKGWTLPLINGEFGY